MSSTRQRMRRFASVLSFFTLLCSIVANPSKADLLLDYRTAPAQSVLFGPGYDDANGFDKVSTVRSLGFNGAYFGSLANQVYVSTNGSILFAQLPGSEDSFFPQPDVRYDARIAPLFDDIYLFDGSPGQVVEAISAGTYYSVTWEHVSMGLDIPFASDQSIQAIWFGQATTLNGFQFQANDIAFSYSYDPTGEINALIGLQKNSSSNFLPAFGTGSAGYVITSNPNNYPYPYANQVIPQGNNFFLFRPNGSGSYVASLETTPVTTAVPEPNSLAIGCLLSFAATWVCSRRQRSRIHPKPLSQV